MNSSCKKSERHRKKRYFKATCSTKMYSLAKVKRGSSPKNMRHVEEVYSSSDESFLGKRVMFSIERKIVSVTLEDMNELMLYLEE